MNKKGGSLKSLVMGIVMIVLFSFFIFSFVSKTITETNPNSEIFNSKWGLNESMSKMESITNNFTATSENLKKQIQDDKPTASDYVFLIFKGAFYIPVAFIGFVFVGMKAITTMLFPNLSGTGLEGIVGISLELIFASIIVTMVLLIVKAIRSGESSR